MSWPDRYQCMQSLRFFNKLHCEVLFKYFHPVDLSLYSFYVETLACWQIFSNLLLLAGSYGMKISETMVEVFWELPTHQNPCDKMSVNEHEL